MRRRFNLLFAISAMLVFLAGLMIFAALAPQGQAAPGSAPVTVVNTPLPVEASITGTISGDVSVTNTPEVNVVNEPTVTVGNSATNPVLIRDVDNPAGQPYAEFRQATIPDGDRNGFAHFSAIPAGKRLVIEYVNVHAQFHSGGQGLVIRLFAFTGGDSNPYRFPTSIASSNVLDEILGSHPVRIYVDPNTEPVLGCARVILTGIATCDMTISGYLADAF